MATLASLLVPAVAAPAQCDLQWQPGEPVASPRGNVNASLLWDPDGAGPSPLLLVAGGSFAIGHTMSCGVATFDGTDWQPLGTFNGSVTALALYNGALVAASYNQIRRFDGTSWQTIGTVDTIVNSAWVDAMVVFQNQLYIAGRFDSVSGATAANVARFNGTAWSPLAGGLDAPAAALALFPFGGQTALFVGGSFTAANGVAASRLAVWTGSSWQAVNGPNGYITSLAVRSGTTATTTYLFAGGDFSTIGGIGAHQVAQLQASSGSWSAMPGLPSNAGPCRTIFLRSTGINSWELLAAQESQVWRWAGSAWNRVGASLKDTQGLTGPGNILWPGIETLSFYGGRYVVGLEDYFGLRGGAWNFDGTTWRTIDGEGLDERVLAVLPTTAATIIGGRFRTVGGITVNGIAVHDGAGWHALGSGLTGGNGEVRAVVRLPNGDLVAGGTFSVANGAPATAVARWNGSTWAQFGNGLTGFANALAVLPNGDLIAGGTLAPVGATSSRHVVRWNGSTWTHVASGVSSTVEALAVTPSGDLIAGGWFQQVGPGNAPASRIARFAGGAWHAMGTGTDGVVRGLTVQPDGAVVACGAFDTAGGVPADDLARWDGTNWQALPPGLFPSGLRAVAALPNGDLVVGGEQVGIALQPYSTTDRAARLRGTAWTPMGVGRDVFSSSVDSVSTFAMAPDGGLFVGGSFHRVASLISANLARVDTTCPASATPYGNGCTGAGGLEQLQATALPWLGATFRARATGLPSRCFAVSLYGFSSSALPLAAVLPQGLPGCTLLATPDSIELLVVDAGTADTQLTVPVDPALVGAALRHQVIALAVDAARNITSVSAGNGLLLTIGAL